MTRLIISLLMSTGIISGCNTHFLIHTTNQQLHATDLATAHSYKISKNIKKIRPKNRFQDPQLDRLIMIALNDAPNMKSAQARVIHAQQLAKGAYSTLWPSAQLNSSALKDHFSFQGVVPAPLNEIAVPNLNAANIALNVNYELDFWGKNRENLASKLNQTFAAQMDLEETGLLLSSAIASAYFQLQNTLIQLDLAKKNFQYQKEMEDIVLARAEQGIESDIPVKTAIANTQAARLSVDDFKRNELQTRHQLAVLIGKNPLNTQIEVMPFTYVEKRLSIPPVLPAELLIRRPDVNASRALAEAAAHQVNVARTAFFPNINLSAVLSAQSFYFSQLFNVRFQTEGVKAALDLPLFDAGARRANLGAKYAEFDLAVNQYNQTLLNALREVSDFLTALRSLDRQIKNQAQALHATELNYQLFQSRYTQGIIDSVQLLEMKQLLIQQKALLYQLKAQRKQTFAVFIAALGGEITQ